MKAEYVPDCYSAAMTVHLELPDAFRASGQSSEEFAREAKLLLALKLFEMGRLSSGQAAEGVGIPKVEFLLEAGRQGVPVVDLDDEEMDQEFAEV